MKYVCYGCGLLGTVILSIVLCLSLSMKSMKAQQLDTEVRQAMRIALRYGMEQEGTNAQSIAMMREVLDLELASKGDIKLEVLEADVEKGILSVRATLSFNYPTGQKGEVHTQKTLIYDEKVEG